MNRPARSFNCRPTAIDSKKFGSLDSYLKFLEGIDIGLAPLLPTGYNRGRSDVKFLEYASRGVAGIYADLEPYLASVFHGESGLFYRKPGELIEQLELLRTNRDLRLKLRKAGYEFACTRLVGGHISERVEWYRSLMTEARSRACRRN